MAGEDPAYVEWVRTLPCCACPRPPRSHPHHRTGGGMGMRAHDHDTMPLCPLCHHDLHALSGRFKGWTRDALRTWQSLRAAETRARSWLGGDDSEIF